MSSKYLPNGTIIGGHYKIIDVLGEDDFEILYLVKNIHREGSFFVIKELFLDVFSERKGNSVETIPEALGVFNKRKAEIIKEIGNISRRNIKEDIKVFAYFEENNTIYTCMAYTPNANVEAYLQFEPKEHTKLPQLEELTQIGKEKKKGYRIWLIGVILVAFVGSLFFAYNQYGDKLKRFYIWDSNKKAIELNSTKERNKTEIKADNVVKNVSKIEKPPVELNRTETKEKIDLLKNSFVEENKSKQEHLVVKKVKKSIKEINSTKDITKDINISSEKNITKAKETNLTTQELSKKSKKDNNLSKIFSEENLHKFLKKYIKITAHSSSKKIMKLYDNKITRYFQFKNITPTRVGKSVRAYNRKWRYRKFKLLNFKILKRYSKNGVNYCDVKTYTKWYVSNPNGKRKSGYSKGFMTIKDTKDGFKVKAIYGIR